MIGKRAMVISGGGAKGSFGCGVAETLRKKGYEYDLLIGSSTGSLQMGLIGLNKFDTLREAYLNVTQSSIFNWNPFTKKGKTNIFKSAIRILLKKDSLGESLNLRKQIDKFFTSDDYNELKEKNINIKAVLVNMTDKKSYAKSNFECEYEDMKDWIWGSCCAPIYMSYLDKDNARWTDGGVKEHIPVQYAIDMGYTEIDVIVHRTKDFTDDTIWNGKNKGIVENGSRIAEILSEDVSENDILLSKLTALNKDVNLNIYYTPYNLTNNSLIFNKEEMKKWWELGNKVGSNGEFECKKIKFKKKLK